MKGSSMTEQQTTPDQPAAFPSVDDMFPLWQREPGRRGALSKAEKAAKQANAKQREAYQQLLDEHAQRGMQLEIVRNDLVRVQQTARTNSETVLMWEQQLRTNLTHAAVALRALAELTYMMGEEMTTSVNTTVGGMQNVLFSNTYGTFELPYYVTVTGGTEIRVTPEDKRRRPFKLQVDTMGIAPEGIAMLVLQFGLDNDRLPERAEQVLRRKPEDNSPEANLLVSLFGDDDEALASALAATDCGNPNCAVHGKNRSTKDNVTESLDRFLSSDFLDKVMGK